MTEVIKADKMLGMGSPIGTSVSDAIASRRARSAAYRKEYDRTAAAAGIARLIVHRRTILGISQDKLARRAKTSNTAISRLESGRALPNVATLQRVFHALDCKLVFGYVDDAARPKSQEYVAV